MKDEKWHHCDSSSDATVSQFVVTTYSEDQAFYCEIYDSKNILAAHLECSREQHRIVNMSFCVKLQAPAAKPNRANV